MSVQHGVVSANVRVDIVRFFSEHVAQDLQDTSGSVHPILTVDAIRFLYSFRNQVSDVIPLFFNVLIPV
jgi:exportin-2 (importin alpha re-exporter)